jgi:hypothetical protein
VQASDWDESVTNLLTVCACGCCVLPGDTLGSHPAKGRSYGGHGASSVHNLPVHVPVHVRVSVSVSIPMSVPVSVPVSVFECGSGGDDRKRGCMAVYLCVQSRHMHEHLHVFLFTSSIHGTDQSYAYVDTSAASGTHLNHADDHYMNR